MINELEKWGWKVNEECSDYIELLYAEKINTSNVNYAKIRIYSDSETTLDTKLYMHWEYKFKPMELIALGKMASKFAQMQKDIKCKSCEENENTTIFEFLEE